MYTHRKMNANEVDHRAAFLQEDKLAATLTDSCRDRTLPAADPPTYVYRVLYRVSSRPRRLYIL
jgi:hypothetical protein